MSDLRQTWHSTQVHDDGADGLPFVDPSSAFASQLPDGGSADQPRRPEDALAEIESLERLIAEVSDDRRSASELNDRPTEPLVVREVASPQRIEVAPCIVCHGTTATSRFAMTGLPEKLVVCDTCGVGSLFPMPTEQRIAELMRMGSDREQRLEPATLRPAAARLRTHWYLRNVPGGGRVLEVTSNDQSATSLVSGSRFDVFSVRISASELDNHRLNEHRVRDLTDAAFDSRSFEAVVLRGTLECHPQPQRLLDEVRRVLRPGGLLITSLPNFASWQAIAYGADWQYLDLPRTLHHFTPETLRRLLLRSEFESVSIRYSTLSNILHQLPFGDLALNCLKRTGTTGPSLLHSMIQCGGTMTVTARLSNLQPVGTLLRSDSRSPFAGAFA